MFDNTWKRIMVGQYKDDQQHVLEQEAHHPSYYYYFKTSLLSFKKNSLRKLLFSAVFHMSV